MAFFIVSTTSDNGNGSLREAITQANINPGVDTIDFSGGEFEDNTADIITLTSGELSITDSLIINGLGAEVLTVSGNNTYRVFNISQPGTEATINGLTIVNGSADGNGNGGGIHNQSVLNLNNSIISDSTATFGGGIYNEGTTTLVETLISDNSADIEGGGIANFGTLTVTQSSLSGNSAETEGGGIANFGTANLTQTTVSGNSAETEGGGIFNNDTITLTQTTVSENTAASGGGISNTSTATVVESIVSENTAASGGGISNTGTVMVSETSVSENTAQSGGGISNTGTAMVSNSTLFANTANIDGGAISNSGAGTTALTNNTIVENTAQSGGGIANISGEVTITNSTITENTAQSGGGVFNQDLTILNNTIVADNVDINPQQAGNSPNLGGNFSGGFNLISDGTGSTGLTNGINGNLVGTSSASIDPRLGALANNGGSTQTRALLFGSPAINAGDNTLVPNDVTTDQRGSGFPRIIGSSVDIGAYESIVEISVNGTPGRDNLNGNAENNTFVGLQGADILTSGGGNDVFAYTNIRDAGDTITDFEIGSDRIFLSELFQSFNQSNLNYDSAISGGFLGFREQGNNTTVLIDPDGSALPGILTPLVTVSGVAVNALANANNFLI
jgi:hypothetical protein